MMGNSIVKNFCPNPDNDYKDTFCGSWKNTLSEYRQRTEILRNVIVHLIVFSRCTFFLKQLFWWKSVEI